MERRQLALTLAIEGVAHTAMLAMVGICLATSLDPAPMVNCVAWVTGPIAASMAWLNWQKFVQPRLAARQQRRSAQKQQADQAAAERAFWLALDGEGLNQVAEQILYGERPGLADPLKRPPELFDCPGCGNRHEHHRYLCVPPKEHPEGLLARYVQAKNAGAFAEKQRPSRRHENPYAQSNVGIARSNAMVFPQWLDAAAKFRMPKVGDTVDGMVVVAVHQDEVVLAPPEQVKGRHFIDKMGLGGEVIRLLNNGLVASQVAELLGVAPETILSWCAQHPQQDDLLYRNQLNLMKKANQQCG